MAGGSRPVSDGLLPRRLGAAWVHCQGFGSRRRPWCPTPHLTAPLSSVHNLACFSIPALPSFVCIPFFREVSNVVDPQLPPYAQLQSNLNRWRSGGAAAPRAEPTAASTVVPPLGVSAPAEPSGGAPKANGKLPENGMGERKTSNGSVSTVTSTEEDTDSFISKEGRQFAQSNGVLNDAKSKSEKSEGGSVTGTRPTGAGDSSGDSRSNASESHGSRSTFSEYNSADSSGDSHDSASESNGGAGSSGHESSSNDGGRDGCDCLR